MFDQINELFCQETQRAVITTRTSWSESIAGRTKI
uniref:Uncharacterized protein n=1 Tax=Rhizophora mucronata TaxID=61149 RepID=A0A2P2J807_RHIMU